MPLYIVPLDGSSAAEYALTLAHPLAGVTGGALELVHVLDAGLFGSDDGASRLLAAEYLSGLARGLGDTVPVRTRVLEGDPAMALGDLMARRPDATVVMTSHGRGAVGRLMFGSVAERIVRGAVAPVLVLRQSTPVSPSVLEHILVPVDGSDRSEAALPVAIRLARATGATLGLVRVTEFEPLAPAAHLAAGLLGPEEADLAVELTEQEWNRARSYLDDLSRRVRERGVRVTWEVRVGRAADEIVRAAETTGTSLVVMTTRGRAGIKRWAFGSVTGDLLRSGAAPVLVLPPLATPRASKPEHANDNGFLARRMPEAAPD